MDKTYQIVLKQIKEYEKIKDLMNAFKLSGTYGSTAEWDELIEDVRIKISLLNNILKESDLEYRKENRIKNEFTDLFDMINDVLPYSYKIDKER